MYSSVGIAALRACLLALALAAQAAAPSTPRLQGFTFTSVSNRIITPNGDDKNDEIVIQVENPSFSEVTGQVFDLRGHHVANMITSSDLQSLQWDGRANNVVVNGGVYIYVIESEGRAYRGSVLVVR
jgi:gliding motility-associated-like protein